jgi:Zn-finger nucleic acid-binding protein
MTDRSGVEIDYCPQCRGVWLDRGELDKIIERTAPPVTGAKPTFSRTEEPRRRSEDDDRNRYGDRRKYDDDDDDRRRGGFFKDLFDFD